MLTHGTWSDTCYSWWKQNLGTISYTTPFISGNILFDYLPKNIVVTQLSMQYPTHFFDIILEDDTIFLSTGFFSENTYNKDIGCHSRCITLTNANWGKTKSRRIVSLWCRWCLIIEQPNHLLWNTNLMIKDILDTTWFFRSTFVLDGQKILWVQSSRSNVASTKSSSSMEVSISNDDTLISQQFI